LNPYPNFAFYSDSGQKLNAKAGFGFSHFGFRLFIFCNPRLSETTPPTENPKPNTVFSLQFFTVRDKKRSTKPLFRASNIVKSEKLNSKNLKR
jgi:hypothetical protein